VRLRPRGSPGQNQILVNFAGVSLGGSHRLHCSTAAGFGCVGERNGISRLKSYQRSVKLSLAEQI
jgi:hypothetical protein